MIVLTILLSWAWWIYLSTHTQMVLAQDALSYAYLGQKIANEGFFPQYFISGPNREPIYPLMIGFAMRLEYWWHVPYTSIMAILGIIILGLNQLCALRLMQLLNIRTFIIALALLYLGFSPALNNAAFSLYSEISALPLILPLMLVTYYLIKHIKDGHERLTILFATLLGLSLSYLTLVKAPFEIIGPFFLATVYMYIWKKSKLKNLIIAAAALSVCTFYGPIDYYKTLNQKNNGEFAITNRAAWALYGSTARRMEPLNSTRLLGALAYMPGDGLCRRFVDNDTCDFWSYKQSDAIGMTRVSTLEHEYSHATELNKRLYKESFDLAIRNPFQYGFLTVIEGMKMFFWESTQIGFVSYPDWLTKIYAHPLFKDVLRLVVGLVTAFAIVFIWIQSLKRRYEPIMHMVGMLIFLFIGVYSLFFILTRYALPIAPLYIIAVAYTANILYNKRHVKH